MSLSPHLDLDLARNRQLELREEAERERIAGYVERLAAQPGPGSLLVAAWLRAVADQLAPDPAAQRDAAGA